MTSPKQWRSLGTVAGASLGLGIARLIAWKLPFRAAAGQLPGYAAAAGFDPRMGVLRLVLVVLLPILGGAMVWRFTRPGARPQGEAAAARRLAPDRPRAAPRPRVLVPAVVAHALTAWVFLVGPLGAGWVAPFVELAVLLAASLGLAAALGSGRLEEGAGYLGAAALVLPFALLGARPIALWWCVGLAAYGLPALARLCAIVRPAAARIAHGLVLVALLPGSVTAAAAAAVRAPRVVSVFEDGHALLPASEYMRGELPYRDVVPVHGLVSDGLLAFVELRLFGDDCRGLNRGEKVSGAFFWPAFYAVGYAATGSPAVAFGGLLLSFLFAPQYQLFRCMASLWTLALALYASRTRKPGAWLACGMALPLCLCIAVEFALYAAGGVAVALWVARGRRSNHLRRLLLGAAISGGAIALGLAAYGLFGEFLRTTFVFVPSLLPVYALGFPRVALAGSGSPVVAALANETLLLYGFVAVSVVLLGAWLPRAPAVGPRARSVLPICAWVVLSMLSVLERWHTGYGALIVPIGLLLLARWLRGGRPWASPRAWVPAAAIFVLACLRRPVPLVVIAADAISRAQPPPGLFALSEPPRARGGLFWSEDAAMVKATGEALRTAGLRDTDTWLDFSSMPGLYYLFDRDCPIRYGEVGFFESESAQREVIAAIERNPRVRGVLMSSASWFAAIDGVANSKRAPLVNAYIHENFHPFYRKGEVEFWLRNDEDRDLDRAPPAGSPR